MASPDLDDGWLKYAHELDTALAVADFTKGARIVLREVFAQIYGPAKAQTAVISPSAIAEGYGMIRQNVSRAIKELTDANVLVKVADGVFRFVKNYEKWVKNDSPRLSPKEVECCQTAPARAMTWKRNGGGKRVSGSIHEGINLDTKRVSGSIHEGINLDTKRVSGSIPPMPPPYRNGRAEFETEGDRRLKETPPNPQGGDGVCVSISGAEPIPIEDVPTPAKSPIDDAELTRVGMRAEKLFPMLDFGIKIRGIAGDGPSEYPLAWIDTALTELHSGNVHTWKYFIGILNRYGNQGGPKTKAAAGKPKRSADDYDDLLTEMGCA